MINLNLSSTRPTMSPAVPNEQTSPEGHFQPAAIPPSAALLPAAVLQLTSLIGPRLIIHGLRTLNEWRLVSGQLTRANSADTTIFDGGDVAPADSPCVNE